MLDAISARKETTIGLFPLTLDVEEILPFWKTRGTAFLLTALAAFFIFIRRFFRRGGTA
jgi:hypothetical protein